MINESGAIERTVQREQRGGHHNFGLRDLVWSETQPKNNKRFLRQASKAVHYRGQSFDIHALNRYEVGPATNKPLDLFEFKIEKEGEDAVIGVLTLDRLEGRLQREAETLITRIRLAKEPNRERTSGLGRALYNNILDYIQYLADSRNETITHTISRDPQGISIEQWNAMFRPILKEHGYLPGIPIDVQEGRSPIATWVKTYHPRDTANAEMK